MTLTAFAPERTVTLPSDQDASGRTLGNEELALLKQAIGSGTLTSTKGRSSSAVRGALRPADWRRPRLRVQFRHGGDPLRRRGDQSGAGRRDRHHADHRHGRADADSLSGRDSGLRRRRSAHLQRHGRDHRSTCSSERTRAIIVTHLFGNPCDMTDIMRPGQATANRGDRRLCPGVPRRGRTASTSARSATSAASACSKASTSPPARAASSSTNDAGARPPDVPVHQQGLGLRRSPARITTSSLSTIA